jgi:hypothetical protein
MGRFRARWFSRALRKELARNLKRKNFGRLLVHQPAQNGKAGRRGEEEAT